MCSLLGQFTPPELAVVAQTWLTGLWGGDWPYIVMLIGFSVIIFVHEFGHFAVAKWCGVRVEAFSLGFGPGDFELDRDLVFDRIVGL